MSEFTVAVDMSCLVPRPMTGVGYHTRNIFSALMGESLGVSVRAFVASAQPQPADLTEMIAGVASLSAYRFPTRLKNALWTKLDWPPIERFTGRADIVHGAFHLLPPSKTARRIVTIHDIAGMRCAAIHDDKELATHRRLLAHAVPRADAIFTVSQSSRNDVIELLGAEPEKVFVVSGGVFLEEFALPKDEARMVPLRERYGIRGDYLIHLGTLEPRKNLTRLVEVYARLLARHDALPQLVLAGGKGWMYEPLFEAIERLGLQSQVVCTGYLDRSDAVTLLQHAQACVYPSLYEGFGLPVLEAMAARVPVLTSNVSSLPEVIGTTGILVEPEEEDSLEAGLTRLLFERGDEGVRIRAARERAEGMTWAHRARTMYGCYEDVLAGRGYAP